MQMMKNINYKTGKTTILLGLLLIFNLGCERDLTDEAVLATFPTTAEIYTDNPVGLTDDFFISFDPAVGANPEAFGTDDNESYEGTSSIRIDVPGPNDPNGTFAGCIFRDRGEGRNLTGYDALTFWAKGSTTGVLGEVGFGVDFLENKFPVNRANIQLSTDWRKYVIPIPNPEKLVQERGMFLIAVGSFDVLGNDDPALADSFSDNSGWVVWLDEIKFERLGTTLTVNAEILNGQNIVQESFSNTTTTITGLSQTVNLATGENVTVGVAPTYFDFNSSNPAAATVDENGVVSVVGQSGTTTITAVLGNNQAQGSLEITALGDFPLAPVPDDPAANVLSIFSDSYTDVVDANFTPGFGGSTTQASVLSIGGEEFVTYENNNFTGIMFDNNPIDGSAMSFLHVDIFAPDASTQVEFQIRDIGSNQEIETNEFNGFPTGDDVDYRVTLNGLTPNEWNSIDIPLVGNLTTQRNNLGAIILVGGPSFILDNIYFFTE
jgi:hypothetical protein